MKKVLFLLIALFTLCATIEANAAPTDKRPKNGYNYRKAKAKQERYNFFNKKHIQRSNGGCGWMNR
jgi:hypothetical protein